MQKKILTTVNQLLIFSFFTHGVLYFVFPDHIYDEGSWIKVIKFGLLLFMLTINLGQIQKADVLKFIILGLGILFFMISSHQISEVFSPGGIKRIFLYLSPLSVILLAPTIDRLNLHRVIVWTILISLLFAFLENYLFRGVFARYDHSNSGGYIRIVSIFINPNNAGLLFSLFFMYVFNHYESVPFKKFILKAIFLLSLLLAIYWTGSKTPLVLLAVFLLFNTFSQINFRSSRSRAVPIIMYGIVTAFVLLTLFVFINPSSVDSSKSFAVRSFSLDTGVIRQVQWLNFFEFPYLDAFLAPNYNDISKTYDIMYIQLWSDLGFWGFCMFIGLMLYMFFKKIKDYTTTAKMAVGLLMLSGFSLVFLLIWPPAYIFLYLVFSDRFIRDE